MAEEQTTKSGFKSFPLNYWVVILMEFFERGSYYGMMSILSVYMTDQLGFTKENVGLIKGTIQPLLYFLPILSGAIADRFGYRKTLMVAFSFLGLGYFLTSQATSYALVFGALVVMGIGAGTFKPIISGTIARETNEENSTLGFGIFYWSINLGAFLFPLILVPFLKSMNWSYVIIASAIGTGIMLIPNIFLYKEPIKQQAIIKKTNLVQTIANAFEIIYSPIVLIYHHMKSNKIVTSFITLLFILTLGYSLNDYFKHLTSTSVYPVIGIEREGQSFLFSNERNMLVPENYKIELNKENNKIESITLLKPERLKQFVENLIDTLKNFQGFSGINAELIQQYIELSDKKIDLTFTTEPSGTKSFSIVKNSNLSFTVHLNDYNNFQMYKNELLAQLHFSPMLRSIKLSDLETLYESTNIRPFFLLFIVVLMVVALSIMIIQSKNSVDKTHSSKKFHLAIVLLIGLLLWFIPGLTIISRIIAFIIYLTVTSLFAIDITSKENYVDHAKFLLMIFLYSGFWILYFQMFDSVLWYVQAYVDGSALNNFVNSTLNNIGFSGEWFFDVEHVTVINAGTIILLQLIISNIVKKKAALPTMISGIAIATVGMAILAISSNIWVFMIGIFLFSIGEMTAHPKFISYIGLIAPVDKKAMYMGYLFLYGVFGSSIGGILGAKLYVHYVDKLNQPSTLWIIFSMIGVVTIIGLLLYNKFVSHQRPSQNS